MKKLIRTSTVPGSLDTFCNGQLKWLGENGFEVVAVSSPGEKLDTVAQREGVRTIAVPMERRISIVKDIVSLVRMIRVIRRERPYIVHSITPKAGLMTMVAAWVNRVPVRIHTFTGLVWPTSTGLKRRILMLMDRIICGCATYVNPEGEGVKRDLLEHGITHKDIHVIANGNVRGIDLEHYSRTPEVMARAQELRQEGVFTFVFVGRLVRDKGINELVSAFERLHEENPATRLVLVGRYEENLDPLDPATVDTIKNHPAIDPVGQQSDIRPYLAASDALAFPSYREGFPNVVIEAGALGLPSVVTNINGSSEIITHGETGLIVPPQDAEALYQGMKQMLEMPADARTAMGEAAQRSVAERYEYHIIWDALLGVYKDLSGERCFSRR